MCKSAHYSGIAMESTNLSSSSSSAERRQFLNIGLPHKPILTPKCLRRGLQPVTSQFPEDAKSGLPCHVE